MSKLEQILIYSIQPEHVLNFLRGRKTIEVRKRDLPQWAKDKLARGEIVEGYGYCTKGGEPLYDGEKIYLGHGDYSETVYVLNGLVVFKFQVSGTTYMKWLSILHCYNAPAMYGSAEYMPHCLTKNELHDYGNEKDLYAHHFTNIQPIEPMGLMSFYESETDVLCGLDGDLKDEEYVRCLEEHRITKAPQSFQSAWVKGE